MTTKERYAGDPNKHRSPIPPEFRGFMAAINLMHGAGQDCVTPDNAYKAINMMREACKAEQHVPTQKQMFHDMLLMMPPEFRALVVAIIRLRATMRASA